MLYPHNILLIDCEILTWKLNDQLIQTLNGNAKEILNQNENDDHGCMIVNETEKECMTFIHNIK